MLLKLLVLELQRGVPESETREPSAARRLMSNRETRNCERFDLHFAVSGTCFAIAMAVVRECGFEVFAYAFRDLQFRAHHKL